MTLLGELLEQKRRQDEAAKTKPAARGAAYRGVIPGGAIEALLVRGIHIASILLVVLSVLGTFYGARGADAPIASPLRIVLDVAAQPQAFLLALLAQAALTVTQWGGKRLAARDPRFWLAYLGSLALSVWWNWSAYGDPLIALNVPYLVAGGIILAGDMLPELALVRD